MTRTADPEEIARFDAMADEWWDETGPAAPLHALNPARISAIREAAVAHFGRETEALAPLAGLTALDIGCGGGLAAEPLARMGARVAGVDASERAVDAARRHARAAGLDIDYRRGAVEELDETAFDIVLALEIIEHVDDVDAFVAAAAARTAPGGLLIAATLNRTKRAFARAILGAEYALGWLPRGTHRWSKFVRPDELIGSLERRGLLALGAAGFSWRPFSRRWAVTRDLSVNYMVWAARQR